METVIWKYSVNRFFSIEVPEDSEILSIQMQGDYGYMWLMLPSKFEKKDLVKRDFQVILTGEKFDGENKIYQGTFIDKGNFVYHVFEIVSPDTKISFKPVGMK